MTLRRPSQVLSDLVDLKTDRLPYPRAGRVEGRHTDGTTRLRFLDGTCEARLGITGGRRGEVLLETPSVTRSRGTAGVPVASLTASRAVLWVERLEPAVLCRGEEQTVTVIGHGFTASTRFEFLLPESRELNPSVSILARRLVDGEHVELDLRVDAEAPLVDGAPLAFGP